MALELEVQPKDKVSPENSNKESEIQNDLKLPSTATGPDENQRKTSGTKDKTNWDTLIKSNPKEILQSLSRQDLNPDNVNQRVHALLERLAKDVPFFEKVLSSAKEKGYSFEVFNEQSPKVVKDFFKSNNAVSATEKGSDKVYFDLDKIQKLAEKHGDKLPFGRAFVEQLGNEGVHIIEDSIESEDDAAKFNESLKPRSQQIELILMFTGQKEPTPSEVKFQDAAIEDLASTIVGHLIGLAEDNNLQSALKLDQLPNEQISDERIFRQMMIALDEAIPQYFPILNQLDDNGKQVIMGRAMKFFMEDKMETGLAERLKDYGVLPKDFKMQPLDKAAILQKIQREMSKRNNP